MCVAIQHEGNHVITISMISANHMDDHDDHHDDDHNDHHDDNDDDDFFNQPLPTKPMGSLTGEY